MNANRNKLRICLLGATVLTPAGILLGCLAMIFCFEPSIGYFKNGLLPTLLTIISWVAVLFLVIMGIFLGKGALSANAAQRQNPTVAALPAVLLAAYGLVRLFWPSITPHASNLATISGVLGVVGSVYFFLSLHKTFPKAQTNLLAVLGFGLFFWSIITLAESYFDLFTPMNAEIKTLLQFSLLGIALMTLSELRFRLGKAMPRMAMIFYGFAMYFCLTFSLSVLVALPVHGLGIPTAFILYAVSLLGLGVYAAIRWFTYMATNLTPITHTSDSTSKEELS